MLFSCPQCRCYGDKPASALNRAARRGVPIYCGRECAGIARRKPAKSLEQRKAEKSAYDAQRRINIADRLRAEKRAYHIRTYNPAKAAIERRNRMPKHVEYCRRPEYRQWKREYDRQYRAREYGEFADCYLLVLDIRNECLSQQSDYEIRMSKGTFGKWQQRRRDYDRLDREEPEIGPMGNLERCEKR